MVGEERVFTSRKSNGDKNETNKMEQKTINKGDIKNTTRKKSGNNVLNSVFEREEYVEKQAWSSGCVENWKAPQSLKQAQHRATRVKLVQGIATGRTKRSW